MIVYLFATYAGEVVVVAAELILSPTQTNNRNRAKKVPEQGRGTESRVESPRGTTIWFKRAPEPKGIHTSIERGRDGGEKEEESDYNGCSDQSVQRCPSHW
ncbi:uncharacterized protein ATNIH1004_004110 [Aspergillus tanneri]|uniref:Uncharacterized protein n=1 Tax=Aspergillus tanneri TaxID=1220188 RepID=A0A5M9N0Q3_9EURO|nr:uncharacterized protein ATNIH1004_004110 [Aspergillus tanneri]KAA8648227.1 hypothetical protein ATNIH1004_004110 [Aspergillus tanneri]